MTDGEEFDEPTEYPLGEELPDEVPLREEVEPFIIDDDEVEGDINDFSAAELVAQATDSKEKHDIFVDLVGHPDGAPSLEELDFMNPDMAVEAIERVLDELVNDGIVRVLGASMDDVGVDDPPVEFYALTDGARRGVDAADRFPRELWTRQYRSVEKTERIQALERLPRPDSE